MTLTFKQKFNRKHGQKKDQSNSLTKVAKLSGIKRSALQKIYNKGIGAFKTAGPSRPNMKKEQWAMARVYASISPGSKSSKIDKKELADGRRK
jgi:hypothetical protein